MEKIASFTIDHIKLKPGVYVSRKDVVGDQIITTFDLRMTSPNDEPVMNTGRSSYYRTSGCYVSPQSQGIRHKNHLFWPHGMQNRVLSAFGRRL